MISFADALARVLAVATRLPEEEIPLEDAHGRTLARGLAAGWPLPPHDNSAVDGYAYLDEALAGHELPLEGSIYAGDQAMRLAPGVAVRITTGARVPEGADTVVAQELVRVEGDRLTVLRRPQAGANIRRAGEDTSAGAPLLGAGTRIDPDAIAVLAAFGHTRVHVVRRPRVAILAGGNEIVPAAQASPDFTADANGPATVTRAQALGCDAVHLGIMPDDRDAVETRIDAGLAHADMLLTIGGASVGDRDFVCDALLALGVTLEFTRVAMRPGKPIIFGHRGDKLVFGLPGNPRAAAVGFQILARPALLAMLGRMATAPLLAALGRDLTKPADVLQVLPATLRSDADGRLWVDPIDRPSSGLLTSALGHPAIVRLPADRTEMRAGEVVEVEFA